MAGITLLKKLFDSLLGNWILLRELQSTNTSEPSGFCHGTASFSSRNPSPVVQDDGRLEIADAELLYHEAGEVEVSTTVKFKFSRKYVWRLKAASQSSEISVWFVKPGTDDVDYLFHKIDIDVTKTSKSERGDLFELKGTGGHLCVEDFYNSSYTFYLADQTNEPDVEKEQPLFASFQTVHEVQGPKKDQTITTLFTMA